MKFTLHRMQITKTHPNLFELLLHLGIECRTGSFAPVSKPEKHTNIIETETECTATPDEEQTIVLLIRVEAVAGGGAAGRRQ